MTRFVLAICMVLLAFAFGFAWRDLRQGNAPTPASVVALVTGESRLTPTQLFYSSFQRIQSAYYREVDPVELRHAAMTGMMAELGDPHTQFLEPRLAEEFRQETRGGENFVGIGARLAPDPLGAKVASVFRGGPAEAAGLRNGDLITTVNGQTIAGMDIQDVVDQIRGEPGTTVTIGLLRGASAQKLSLTIPRGKIVVPTVEGRILQAGRIGHLTISTFAQPTARQFDETLQRLEAEGITGLVIDVRSNPGGLLDSAIEILSRFLDDRVAVRLRYRGGREEVQRTLSGAARRFPYPVVVLINEDSASAAEILAGVLREYRLVTLVGEHTWGKASVQNVVGLVDGSSAKITIARYALPQGQDISRQLDEYGQYKSGGIRPDIEVELDLGAWTVIGDPQTDNQLRKAVEVIQSKRGEARLRASGLGGSGVPQDSARGADEARMRLG
jgi:carboxyl-terminal processing protease